MLGNLPIFGGSELRDEPEEWAVANRQTLGRGLISDFMRDELPTKEGPMAIRDYLTHPGAVAVIAMDDDDHIVVLKQYRHPLRLRMVEPPAGLLDNMDEDPLTAAKRELAEEAQLAAEQWLTLVDVSTSPGCLQETIRIYLARDLSVVPPPSGFVAAGEEAELEVGLAKFEDLVSGILEGHIQSPTMCLGVLALDAILHRGGIGRLRGSAAPRRGM